MICEIRGMLCQSGFFCHIFFLFDQVLHGMSLARRSLVAGADYYK